MDSLGQQERTIVTALKRLLEPRIELARVEVFGSRARGDHTADSDLDVLVLVNEEVSPRVRRIVSDCAWEASFGSPFVLSTVVYPAGSWDHGPLHHSLLAQAVAREGIAL